MNVPVVLHSLFEPCQIGAGVYIIGHESEVLYVGQSNDVNRRLEEHSGWSRRHPSSVFQRLRDEFGIDQMDGCWVLVIPQDSCDAAYSDFLSGQGFLVSMDEESCRRQAEAELIINLSPRLNYALNGGAYTKDRRLARIVWLGIERHIAERCLPEDWDWQL
jgi:hypothetical protein